MGFYVFEGTDLRKRLSVGWDLVFLFFILKGIHKCKNIKYTSGDNGMRNPPNLCARLDTVKTLLRLLICVE